MKKHYLLVIIAFLSFAADAQIVNIPDANFKAALLNHAPSIDTNDDNEIQVTEALATAELYLSGANISNLSGIQSFPNLIILDVEDNNLTTIDVTGLTSLSNLNVTSNQLTSINLGNANNLYNLGVTNNQLTSLDLSGKTIVVVGCGNNLLTTINLAGADIHRLYCNNNQLTQLYLSGLINLTDINFTNNQISAIEFSGNSILTTVECRMNPIMELDFSNNPELFEISVFNPILNTLILKNGNTSQISLDWLDEAPNLRYVCTDKDDEVAFASYFAAFGFPLVNVNSYCTFTPGGTYNTIAGKSTFDSADDGCSPTDQALPNLRLDITNGTGGGGSVFTDQSGNANFFAFAGNFTVEPKAPNAYFEVTPVSTIVNFPDTNNNTTLQNFCLARLGTFLDLEITMAPILPARPGFPATYVLHYKNKGTETMSGTVRLQFQDDFMDFTAASTAVTTQTFGVLEWAYTDLQPLETRSITVTLTINTPTETPPVNMGDQLNFAATVFPVEGDETPQDNVFGFKQEVLQAFDPNDITCTEGETIGVEQVGQFLHYVIRFQNTGNFYAENVVVKNTIDDPNYDLSTFELIGSSHPQVTRITGNEVEFIFEGINLPADDDDEPGSHGYIVYKIKTNNNLVIGDSVAQFAEIYFDFNFPIITNTATTTVTALGVDQFESAVVSIYPNPAKNTVTISSDDIIKTISLYDLQGRLLGSDDVDSGSFVIDISGRSTGIYLVKVETVSGIRVERLVKE